MRTVVSDRDMVELDIKPSGPLEKYRQLLEEDSRELLKGTLQETNCPGCGKAEQAEAFIKSGYTYRRCLNCETLYVSPRPGQTELDRFYREGQASAFWRKHILAETLDARRLKIMRPRARWVLDVLDKYLPQARNGVSLGYHNQTFVEELKRLEPELFPVRIVSPIADEEFGEIDLDGLSLHTESIQKALGEENSDVFLLFDSIDRAADPDTLLQQIVRGLSAKGLLLVNATMVSGFDLQVLWDRSPTIYPPERLNLFSTEGIQALFQRNGLQALEISTPGTFDVENVRRYVTEHPDEDWPQFIRYMLLHRDDDTLHALQAFLQQHLMSSFGRFVVTLEHQQH